MSIDYDEAIAELRSEEKRLEEELNQVRAAIPGMIILRNRSRAQGTISKISDQGDLRQLTLKGTGRFTGVGATKAVSILLGESTIAMTSREIFDSLKAQGWTTEADRPLGTLSATLKQMGDKGVLERVGEGWKITTKPSVVAAPSWNPNGQPQPLQQ